MGLLLSFVTFLAMPRGTKRTRVIEGHNMRVNINTTPANFRARSPLLTSWCLRVVCSKIPFTELVLAQEVKKVKYKLSGGTPFAKMDIDEVC